MSATTDKNDDNKNSTLNEQQTTSTSTSNTTTTQKSMFSGLSGMISGLVATLLLHPIEVLKIRMQGDAKTTFKYTLREIIILSRRTGLYNGISANALASTLAWGTFFGVNDLTVAFLKQHYIATHGADENGELPKKAKYLIDFFASSFASIFAQVCTNPLWLMKTRMSLDRIPQTKETLTTATPTTPSTPSHFYQSNLTKISANHYNMILQQYHTTPSLSQQHNMIFTYLKHNTPHSTNLSLAGAPSVLLANSTSTQQQLTRNVLQSAQQQPAQNQNTPYKHLFRGLAHIYKTEGFFGLYKGFSASLLGSTHGAIVMFVYQSTKSYLDKAVFTANRNTGNNNIQNDGNYLSLVSSATIAAFVSKIVATVVTYPTQVIRTGLQDHRSLQQHQLQQQQLMQQQLKNNNNNNNNKNTTFRPTEYKYGIVQATRDVYKHKGFMGFYRGLSMQMLRASVGNVIVFNCWEAFKLFLERNLSSNTSNTSSINKGNLKI